MLARLGTISAIASLSLLPVIAPTMAAADEATPSNELTPSTVELLFVQTARDGTLRPVKGEQDVYTLTLRGVASRVTSFTDRPLRATSPISVEEFLQNWDGGSFETDPPNAALVVDDAPRSRDTFVVELTAPDYDAKRDVLRYTATLIRDEPDGRLVGFSEHVDEGPPTKFGGSSLFIDSLPSTTMTIEFSDMPAGSAIALNFVGSAFLEAVTFQPTAGTFERTTYEHKGIVVQAGTGATAAATAVVRFCVAPGTSVVSVAMNATGGGSVTIGLGSESKQFTTPGDTLDIPENYQLEGCGQ